MFGRLETTCIAIICSSGRRAAEVCARVEAPTACSLSPLAGGMTAWRDAGVPVVSADVEPPPPLATAGDDPTSMLAALRSCFVTALVEGAMAERDDLDPMVEFSRALTSASVSPHAPAIGEMLALADHLAAAHR